MRCGATAWSKARPRLCGGSRVVIPGATEESTTHDVGDRPVMNALVVAGVLTPIENLLRGVLDWLHSSVGLPWAWSIVALTVIVRMVLVPLTVKQIHSMQNLQRYAPQMKEIQKKYKNDRQKQNEELMKFYRENNINPAASCLPMLFQLPVFIALYYVLRNFSNHPPGGDLSWLYFVPNIAAH